LDGNADYRKDEEEKNEVEEGTEGAEQAGLDAL
jgi:hypothetical protein